MDGFKYTGTMVAKYPATCDLDGLLELLRQEVRTTLDFQVQATQPRQIVRISWNELGGSWRILDCVYFKGFYMEEGDWLRLLSDPMLAYLGEGNLDLLKRYINEERGFFLRLTPSLDAVLCFLSVLADRNKLRLVASEPRAAVPAATYRIGNLASSSVDDADFLIEQDGAKSEWEADEYSASGLRAYYCTIVCREEWMAHRLTSTSERSGFGKVFKGPFMYQGRWSVQIYERVEKAIEFLGVVFKLKKVG